jgi:DHA2 family multidrug resistance protein
MVTILFLTLERAPMNLGLLKEGDWFGIATMAVGLSSLQAVLEEGNKDDWFGSPFIVKLAITAAVSLSLFIANELIVEKPLLKLRLLTNRNFGMGTLSAVFLGFGLFGSIYRQRAGLDRPAATAADPAGAEADAAHRCALHCRVRPPAVRRQFLHEHDDVAGLFG